MCGKCQSELPCAHSSAQSFERDFYSFQTALVETVLDAILFLLRCKIRILDKISSGFMPRSSFSNPYNLALEGRCLAAFTSHKYYQYFINFLPSRFLEKVKNMVNEKYVMISTNGSGQGLKLLIYFGRLIEQNNLFFPPWKNKSFWNITMKKIYMQIDSFGQININKLNCWIVHI